MSDQENVAEEVKRLLRQRGFTGPLEEDPTLEEGASLEQKDMRPEDDPLHALDLNTYTDDKIQRFPIDPESIQDLQPEEKERIRRTTEESEEASRLKDPWMRYVPTLGTITVSEEEKEEYLRALLQEQRFEIPLQLVIGKDTPFVVRVRSLYAAEKEVIALAVEQVVKDYPIRSLVDNQTPFAGAAVAVDYFLRLSVMTQIVSVNGVAQNPFDATVAPGELPEHSPKRHALAKEVRLKFATAHQAQFRLLVQALNLFQNKQLILEDAMVNRDFWKPADTN
jgi:hypothetical protein